MTNDQDEYGYKAIKAKYGYMDARKLNAMTADERGEHYHVRRAKDGDERWCFNCRRHRDFIRFTMVPTLDPGIPLEEQAGAYYGPSQHVECGWCGATDGDCFPGTGREWPD